MKLKKLAINESSTLCRRYGLTATVTKISDNEYLLEGTSRIARGGFTNSGARFFDLEGGPCIAIGDLASFLDIIDDRRVTDFVGLDTDKEHYAKIKITVG
jgi:hypothetical protein